jgi:(S)-sulfolactate dehydrogenase
MPAVVITEFMDKAAVAMIASRWPTHYDPGLVDDPAALQAHLADARALVVRNRTQVNAALLSRGPGLRMVGRLGVGLDNIDLEACASRGITVYPAVGANDDAVAEYVVCAVLILRRPAFLQSALVAAGQWPRNQSIGREMAGARAGLVGFGRTARKTAVRLRALGMQVAAYDPVLPAEDEAWREVERLDLETILTSSDVVSLHVPLTAQTRHLINAEALARMKADAVLVNAARGGVVDEAALAAALNAGRLGGAAIDVFEREPLDGAQAARLVGVKNLILTPHIAGVTEESNVRVSSYIAQMVIEHLGAA